MWRAEQSRAQAISGWLTLQFTLNLPFQMSNWRFLRFNLNWCLNRRCRWSWRLTELSAERFFSTKTLGRQTWSGWIGQFQRDLLPRMDFYMQAYNIGRLHFHTLLYSWVNEASEFQHLLTHHEECVARAMALCEGNFMKQTANSLLANIGGKCG